MKVKDKYIDDVLKAFQKRRGRASTYCFNKELAKELIYNVMINFHVKHRNEQIFIIVDNYDFRCELIKYLKFNKQLDLENDYNIKVITKTYINPKYHYVYYLCILYGSFDIDIINKLNKECVFIFNILDRNILDNEFITKLRTILPDTNITDISNIVNTDNLHSPVEEHRYGVDLPTDDRENYDKCTKYINDCISVFNNLSNIEKCKNGDDKLGISAADYRDMIAKENGWREDLDTNIPFMKQIDDVFNPNTLYERACNFYNIAKKRRDLVSDNRAKFETIRNICIDNKDKKILIISKRGEFANELTKYINGCLDISCADYHDYLEPIPAVDELGNPIYIKSGKDKGKQKYLHSQAQSSLNEERFNHGVYNVLSIKETSNPKLKIACDIVIFTSSLCNSIIDIKLRFTNIKFNTNPLVVYKVYCNNTIEQIKLLKDKVTSETNVINETNIDLVSYDENSGDIVL